MPFENVLMGTINARTLKVQRANVELTKGAVSFLETERGGCWLTKEMTEELIIYLIRASRDRNPECWIDDQFAAQLLKELYYNA